MKINILEKLRMFSKCYIEYCFNLVGSDKPLLKISNTCHTYCFTLYFSVSCQSEKVYHCQIFLDFALDYAAWSSLAISELQLSAATPLWLYHRAASLPSWIEFSCLRSAAVGKAARLLIYWLDAACHLVIPLRQVTLAQLSKYHHQSGKQQVSLKPALWSRTICTRTINRRCQNLKKAHCQSYPFLSPETVTTNVFYAVNKGINK